MSDIKQTVKSFEKSLESKYNVQLSLFFRKGEPERNVPPSLKLDSIYVPKGERGLGIGSKVMQEIADFCDTHGLIALLTPSKDFGASSVTRLRKFYGEFGFVRNLGRNKNFIYSETMIRLPKGTTKT